MKLWGCEGVKTWDCTDTQGCGRICQDMQGYARICKDMQVCEAVRVWGCENVRMWAREYVRMWIYEKVRTCECASVSIRECESVRMLEYENVRTEPLWMHYVFTVHLQMIYLEFPMDWLCNYFWFFKDLLRRYSRFTMHLTNIWYGFTKYLMRLHIIWYGFSNDRLNH